MPRRKACVKLFGREIALQNENVGVVIDTPIYVDDWMIADVEKAISPYWIVYWKTNCAKKEQTLGETADNA